MTKALYSVAVLVSAFLLFLVQPLFARMLLPTLGGSPAVWNTALVFYQGTLLLGYAYAHWAASRLTGRLVFAHVALLALGATLLPLRVPDFGPPPTEGSPVPWLLGMLAIGVGLPFFLTAASSPLLQRWFSKTGHPQATDPYFLYAASNLGSLVALLGYPFLFELTMDLPHQSKVWSSGFLLLIVLFGLCALVVSRSEKRGEAKPQPHEPIPRPRIARWVALAFVPSSLLMGVTTYVSTEIAAVPLMWVVPLAIYLLTFILAFAERKLVPTGWVKVAARLFIVLPLVVTIGQLREPLWLALIAGFGGFFLCSWACHAELSDDKPPPGQLTEFFLWVSLGGVLGGLFCGIVAPVVFKQVLEYPLALVLCAALLAPRGKKGAAWDLAFPAATALAAFLSLVWLKAQGDWYEWLSWKAMIVPGVLAVLAFARPLRFALSVAVVAAVPVFFGPMATGRAYQSRGFFGTLVVKQYADQRTLQHGTTLHGQQATDPELAKTPSSYYHPTGPCGDILEHRRRPPNAVVGVVGLGVGTLLAYSRPGEDWTIFEIDPQMVKVASDPKYFTYLSSSRGKWSVDIGDARLRLTQTEKRFDVLLLDAYSSDAVPVHLVTREAITLYMSRLRPGGILGVHVSNRYMHLWPLFAAAARELGLVYRRRFDQSTDELVNLSFHPFKNMSNWLVLAEDEKALGSITLDPNWAEDDLPARAQAWTDDRSSILTVLRGSPWNPVRSE